MKDCYRIIYKTWCNDEPFVATCWFISRKKLLEACGRNVIEEWMKVNGTSKEEHFVEDIFEELCRDGSVEINWGTWIEIESDKICLEEDE